MIVKPLLIAVAFIFMRKHLFISLFCLVPLFMLAQDQFLVYSMKGEITSTQKDRQGKIQTSDILPANSTIQLPPGAAITFIWKKGGIFSLVKEGNYSLKNYSDSCDKNNNVVFQNYLRFIWDNAIKPGQNRRAYFSYHPGAVVRDHFDIWIDPIFDTVNYSGNGDFPLTWYCYTAQKKFRFAIYSPDDYSKPIHDTILASKQMQVSHFINRIKPGSSCYWGVSFPREESDDLRLFNLVSKDTYDSLLTTIHSLQPVFEADAEKAFRTAFMLENAHYFAEAKEYYSTATILAPANKFYRSTLGSFAKYYEFK